MPDGSARIAEEGTENYSTTPPHERRSVAEDFEALFEDGKTYAEAELAFQRTRARLAASHVKSGLVYGIFALFLLHMVLIGLTVGAILILAPRVGPLLATAIVAGVLLAGVIAFGLAARSRFGRIGALFSRSAS